MLNEIYRLLKMQLLENEIKELREKQCNWLKYRDQTRENESGEFCSGSMTGVQYNS